MALRGGLVGYWPLDENAGTTALDYSDNGKNGPIMNGVLVNQNGKVGKAMFFDNFDDRIYINDFGSLSNFTMSAWIYITGSPRIYGHSIIGTDTWSSAGDFSFQVDTQRGYNAFNG